jgi:hypothetical protein
MIISSACCTPSAISPGSSLIATRMPNDMTDFSNGSLSATNAGRPDISCSGMASHLFHNGIDPMDPPNTHTCYTPEEGMITDPRYTLVSRRFVKSRHLEHVSL